MSNIEAGVRIMMELAGIKDKLPSFFVGYIKNRCVITVVPVVPQVNREMLMEHLYKGNSVTVRYIHSGTVLGFTTEILHVAFSPFPLLFFKYPERIESFNLRKAGRVGCLFPATVILEDVCLAGALSDISISGCNIVLPTNDEQTLSVEIGDVLLLRCPLLFGVDQAEISCTVRQLSKSGVKARLGLMFTDVPDDLLARVNVYIEQTLMFLDSA
ncbi:flagellar brake protein [Desulfonatronum sp. SC1]|uniref:flagellar brake domain-containing protein n=1 Tax=Desulfonatronum sp. SC1 TaxID=2109626 RepID=UPI00130503CB|nr:flagellar brake protein [Desulfonatronum sp. SC1]